MKKYYIYCFLDPRKPGEFRYKDICLDYEPFYIGKGSGYRINAHFYPSNLKSINYKNSKIKNLFKEGLKPIIRILSNNLNEESAYEIENKLVSTIGRSNIKMGPLCNLTDGGKGALNLQNIKKRKKVYKFSLFGEFLDEYESLTEAAKNNNLFVSDISKCCKGDSNTHGGFFWSFKRKNEKFIKNKKSSDILKFDLNGNLLETYESITNTSISTGISHSHISRCCKGELNKINNFYFRYYYNNFPLNSNKLTNKPVFKIDGTKLIEFESVKKASENLKISEKNIIRRCQSLSYYDDLYLIYKEDYLNGVRKEFSIKGNGEKKLIKKTINGSKITEYSSISEASKFEKISRRKISNLLKTKEVYNGYIFTDC